MILGTQNHCTNARAAVAAADAALANKNGTDFSIAAIMSRNSVSRDPSESERSLSKLNKNYSIVNVLYSSKEEIIKTDENTMQFFPLSRILFLSFLSFFFSSDNYTLVLIDQRILFVFFPSTVNHITDSQVLLYLCEICEHNKTKTPNQSLF